MARVAFLVIYSDSTEQNLSFVNSVSKKDRGVNVPLMLMLMRWDGKIGFPGGKIELGEDSADGLAREVKEEIGFDCDKSKMKLVSNFKFTENDVELFAYEVSKDKLKSIMRVSTETDSFLIENQGCFAVQIANFIDNENYDIGGFEEFKMHNFCASARVELDMFINYLFTGRG